VAIENNNVLPQNADKTTNITYKATYITYKTANTTYKATNITFKTANITYQILHNLDTFSWYEFMGKFLSIFVLTKICIRF
jgi:vancomycin resistance protein YoaR